MANLVLARAASGRLELRSSYFSLASALLVPDSDGKSQTSTPRNGHDNSLSFLTFDGKRLTTVTPRWAHLLPDIAAAGGATGLTVNASGQYTSNNLATISGVAAVAGDELEVSPAIARAFRPAIAPGTYGYVSLNPPTIELLNPPVYQLDHSNAIGGAPYYRVDPNNANVLEGLGAVFPTIKAGSIAQARPGIPVTYIDRFFDGNYSTAANGASQSWKGFTCDFDPIITDVIAIEWSISANRQSYDLNSQDANANLIVFGGHGGTSSYGILNSWPSTVNASTLKRHSSTVWANSAAGVARYYARPDNPFAVAGFKEKDDGSRVMMHDFRAICAGVNCQIKLPDGTVPEVGTILSVSDVSGKTFYPAIAPGNFRVLKNDLVGAWRVERIIP